MTQLALANGQHASGSAEWWSPPEIVDPARELFGGFDLDPASCSGANAVIRARRIFTAADDGLRQPWDASTLWCNPPSKKGESSAWEWWCKAATEWRSGRCARVFFVCFNASSFMTSGQFKARERGLPTPQQAARVEFVRRIQYLRRGKQGPERGDAPPHGSALLLLSNPEDHAAFAAAYAHLGDSLLPARPAQRSGGAP